MRARCCALALLPLVAAVQWRKLACPASDTVLGGCAQPALPADAAVTLFFQLESRSGGGGFACVDAAAPALTYCARNWTQPESGAAGSCFFLLPAGRAYACSAHGAVNSIDALYAPLAAPVLGAPAPLTCPPSGALTGRCTQAPLGQDAWVVASYRGAAPGAASAFACTTAGAPVCSFATALSGPTDASSCSFLLAGNASLECAVSQGAIAFDAPATALPLALAYAGNAGAPDTAPCPRAGPKPNDCDCAVDTAGNATDAMVAITATTPDGSFNSFHCYVSGGNVCGWGSSAGMNGSLATCVFLLPAGERYDCAMEWGAATFLDSRVVPTRATLFGGGGALAAAAAPARLLRGPSSARGGSGGEARTRALWAAWKAQHGVAYGSAAEEGARYRNFVAHVAAADAGAAHVRGQPHLDPATGLPTRFNALAALSLEEFARLKARAPSTRAELLARLARAGLLQGGGSAGGASPAPSPSPPPAPPTFDWRAKGVVTGVKDQGQCGSCWSFSTTGAVESQWAVAGNALVSLSEQQLVSCDTTSSGCDGGYPNTAMEWLQGHGADTEASYPYVSGAGAAPACNASNAVRSAVNVTGWRLVPGNSSLDTEAHLMDWLAAYGPVSVLVDAMTQIWWPYTGGVVSACCDVSTDHAVLLVGYGESAEEGKYWVIKNSWSKSWGEDGYIRLSRGTNECGIGTFPVIPTVAGGVLPPPPPPPPPRPVWQCPPDATASHNTTTRAFCLWDNSTATGWHMPPSTIESDCTYFKQGYMGYTFDARLYPTEAAYPCPPSFSAEGDGGQAWFCMLTVGEQGFTGFPATAQPECSAATEGVLGFSWPLAG